MLQNISVLISFIFIFCIFAIAFLSGIMSSASLKYTRKILQDAFHVDDNNLIINTDFLEESVYTTQNIFSEFEESYIVYDDHLNVYAVNNIDKEMQNILKVFVYSVQQDESENINNIEYKKNSYRVVSEIIKSDDKTWIIQIIQNTKEEKRILGLFTNAMIITGSFGIITMIIIGWYFAGKRLEPITDVYLKQRRFIADASHELKTPLTIIQTNVDVLRAKENQNIKDNISWLENIESEIVAMRRLIDDMLILADAEDNGLDIELEQIHLSRLIKDTCMRQKLMSESRGVSLHYEQGSDIVAYADKNRMEQLVKIFVDNASKYSKYNGNVWIRLYVDNDNVILEFEDDGIGMDHEEMLKIFDRFYRADKSRRRENGSVGLGLSIAKEIIDAHDGTVQIESEKTKGTLFKITFFRMAVTK
jgi:signal transduction histidine kinase